MPRRVVADGVIMLTVKTAVCGITALGHIPWAVTLIVTEWVTVTDVVCTCFAILIDAVLGAYPVAHVGIVVTRALRRILLTRAGLGSTEESAHGVIALLVAIWAVRGYRARFVSYVAEWTFFSWADLSIVRTFNPFRAGLFHGDTEGATKVLALLHVVGALGAVWAAICFKGAELVFFTMA